MNDVFSDYKLIFEKFIARQMAVEDFQFEYMDRFKREKRTLDEPLYELLDEVFGDVDSFSNDKELINNSPGFYLNEEQLRIKILAAVTRLRSLKAGPVSPSE